MVRKATETQLAVPEPSVNYKTSIPIGDIILPDKVKRQLNVDKIQMLAGSMNLIGLKHAITVSSDMVLIAGNHRLAAARALGWKEIKAEIVPTDEILNELVTIDENLMRHDLTVLEQGLYLRRRNELLIALDKRAVRGAPGEPRVAVEVKGAQPRALEPNKKKKVGASKTNKITTKDIAQDMGMSERGVQERVQIANGIDETVLELISGLDIADNKSELLRLAKLPAREQRMVVEQLIGGKIKTVKEGTSAAAREKQRAEFDALAEDAKKLPDTMVLVNADMFDHEENLTDESIDMVLTDFPYVDSWKDFISPAMMVLNRVMKPSTFAVLVIGHVRLPEIFDGLRDCKTEFGDKALKFYHICALAHSGHLAAMHSVGAMNGFKPVIVLQKPPYKKPYKMYNDLIEGSGRSKETHDWEQSLTEILPMIDAFSKPGDVVLDPCMGSGTYGIAAKLTLRRFVGVEIDKNTFEDARRRIVQAEE
jgi:site-specific DNA-methyltransferase (adenine-specific)